MENSECIICGVCGADGGKICRRCGDPEMVFIHYNRLTIKMTPEQFFFNKIRNLLTEDGVRLSTPYDCRGLILKIKAPRGVIGKIEVYRIKELCD